MPTAFGRSPRTRLVGCGMCCGWPASRHVEPHQTDWYLNCTGSREAVEGKGLGEQHCRCASNPETTPNRLSRSWFLARTDTGCSRSGLERELRCRTTNGILEMAAWQLRRQHRCTLGPDLFRGYGQYSQPRYGLTDAQRWNVGGGCRWKSIWHGPALQHILGYGPS